ncbi:MAG: hypothetical protein IPJ88_04470 [Myxococcales bacterium]|nr:MAG: hypothetical protein IPJ88_04470 [Myxococcales bacterium]
MSCSLETPPEAVEIGFSSSSARSVTLNVASYNLFQRPAWFDSLAGQSNPECRALAVGSGLLNFEPKLDIVALQEGMDTGLMKSLAVASGFSNSLLNQPPKASDTLGCFDEEGRVWRESDPSQGMQFDGCKEQQKTFTVINGGLALLTPHSLPELSPAIIKPCTPNLDEAAVSWPYCAMSWSDIWPNKGLLYASINIVEQNISFIVHVITTHLSASTQEVRDKQLDTLHAFIENKFCLDPQRRLEPILLLGDLNVKKTPGDREDYDHMLELLSTSCLGKPRDLLEEFYHSKFSAHAPGTMMCEGSQIGECAPPTPDRRLDYIFALEPSDPSRALWNLNVLEARTLEFRNTDCAYQVDGKEQNSLGRLSDHAMIMAQLEWTTR